MRKQKFAGSVALIVFAAGFVYAVGYQHGLRASETITLSSLRQVGISFRADRNDVTRFHATSSVPAMPSP